MLFLLAHFAGYFPINILSPIFEAKKFETDVTPRVALKCNLPNNSASKWFCELEWETLLLKKKVLSKLYKQTPYINVVLVFELIVFLPEKKGGQSF